MNETKNERSSLKDKNVFERRKIITEQESISLKQLSVFGAQKDTHTTTADQLVENAIGFVRVPIGIAEHFVINGKKRLIAMATEERTVIAAAGKGAKQCVSPNGFATSAEKAFMRGSVLYSRISVTEWKTITEYIDREQRTIIEQLLLSFPRLKERQNLRISNDAFLTQTDDGNQQMFTISVNVPLENEMGANTVTKIAEHLAWIIACRTGIPYTTAICSNFDAGYRVRVVARFDVENDFVVNHFLDVATWGSVDHTRFITQTKGIMNGISAVALATGQDTRAIEAAIHSFAHNAGKSNPIVKYKRSGEGHVGAVFQCTIPVGTVGGMTQSLNALAAQKLMRITSAADLACVMGAVGLAQNFAALLALATEGITESHLRVLARKK